MMTGEENISLGCALLALYSEGTATKSLSTTLLFVMETTFEHAGNTVQASQWENRSNRGCTG